jgi:hypothetical protein
MKRMGQVMDLAAEKKRDEGISSTWSAAISIAIRLFPLFLFIIALLPRAFDLVARSTVWHGRARSFINAILNANWERTLQVEHPGVTTMWLAGIAYRMGKFINPDFDNLPLNERMAFELVPLVLVISLAIVLIYFLLTRIFDRQVAAVVALMLALDPYHITISKTLHVDALMSIFLMISALYIYLYISPSGAQRRRYLLLSGFFAGLALLSKTPAIFILPFFFLSLAAWKLSISMANGRPLVSVLTDWRYWVGAAKDIVFAFVLWLLPLIITYVLLWPSMWVQPAKTLTLGFVETLQYRAEPHGKPLFFLGKQTTQDPGILFYPVYMAIRTTAVTLPFFIIGLVFTFSRRLNRHKRLILLLSLAFIIFFMLQMTLGAKKQPRYALPALQFIILIAGFGAVYFVRWLTRGRQTLIALSLLLILAIMLAFTIPRHPYYGTHYNYLLGSPKVILESGIVPGQEQGEGLQEAASYLNSLPLSKLFVVASQIDKAFRPYFHGKGVRMTDDNVDYLVFTRNYAVRGFEAENGLWEKYNTREPKYVVEFDGVPYVWVYKVGPVIDESLYDHVLNADVGEDMRLLGYNMEPEQRTGETRGNS